jgi:hypothetical protein
MDVVKGGIMWELALDDLKFQMYRLECIKHAPDRAELRAALEQRIVRMAQDVRAATDRQSLTVCR